MPQTRFSLYSCSPQKRENLDKKLAELYDKIRSRFKFFGTFQDVMLPMTVLRRLDCVLEPTKDNVLAELDRLKGGKVTNVEPVLNRAAGQAFHNVSRFTFEKLKDDPENIAANLTHYIKSFSGRARSLDYNSSQVGV